MKKHLDRIGDQVRLSNQIISGLLDMVRDRPLPRESFPMAALLDKAAEAVPRPPGVTLEIDAAEGLTVRGDPVQLGQAVVNLLLNAVQAAAPEGAVRLVSRADAGGVAVDVEDDGPGVPEAVRGRLFEPLITTKEHGNGLGLALVKRVAERHGGTVLHEPRAGGGTRFTLRLPAP